MTTLLLTPLMIAALACPPPQVGVQSPAKQTEAKVNVTVVVILASDKCKCIDTRLQDVACQMQKLDPKMTGFRLVSMAQQALPANEKFTFHCIDDATLQVIVKQCLDADGWVGLTVTEPGKAEIVYRAVCGKFFLINTDYRVKEHIPPLAIGQAFCQATAGGPAGPLLAVNTLLESRCRPHLIVAICVQPCKGK